LQLTGLSYGPRSPSVALGRFDTGDVQGFAATRSFEQRVPAIAVTQRVYRPDLPGVRIHRRVHRSAAIVADLEVDNALKTARLSRHVVSVANKPSTALSQTPRSVEEEMGAVRARRRLGMLVCRIVVDDQIELPTGRRDLTADLVETRSPPPRRLVLAEHRTLPKRP
jgi:hypothetical protein